jgi:hypothetical protein
MRVRAIHHGIRISAKLTKARLKISKPYNSTFYITNEEPKVCPYSKADINRQIQKREKTLKDSYGLQ